MKPKITYIWQDLVKWLFCVQKKVYSPFNNTPHANVGKEALKVKNNIKNLPRKNYRYCT